MNVSKKKDEQFHVDTLTEWLNFKIKTYLKQADKTDKGKLKAIFRHFGFLDKSTIPNLRNAKPLTPKEIGYLSPRVPHPDYLEKPVVDTITIDVDKESKPVEAKKYETKQVLLENGKRILMKVCDFALEDGFFDSKSKTFIPLAVEPGRMLRIKTEDFVFAGVVEDPQSPYNQKPLGKLVGEELYKVFTIKKMAEGVFSHEAEGLSEEIGGNLPELLKVFWEQECENNLENNPDKLPLPI